MASPTPVWITFSQTNLGEIHMEDPGPAGMKFGSFPEAFDYLRDLHESAKPDDSTGPAPAWTPRHYGMAGTSRSSLVHRLTTAAAALARAEEALRLTAPHPRDGDVDERQKEYARVVGAVGSLFEEVQEEARRADAASGRE